MSFLIKKIIQPFFRWGPVQKVYSSYIILKWKLKGKTVPAPPAIKRKMMSDLQSVYHTNALIETGTFKGGMVEAQRKNFDKIYSIELDKSLWEDAHLRFEKYNHIEIIQGDSGLKLKEIIPKIKKKSIFWLDGHYSGMGTAKGNKETPIFEELKSILGQKINHIILIDDARCFDGTGDYPTFNELSRFILQRKPGSKIATKDDVIRVILDSK
jgi:hypothetical protein